MLIDSSSGPAAAPVCLRPLHKPSEDIAAALPSPLKENLRSSTSTTASSFRINEARRKAYLREIMRGDTGVVMVISGASGSGKSFIARTLGDEGIQQSTRLITRPRRPCDPPTDVAWQETANAASLDNILFSYTKHGDFYGFMQGDLERAARQKDSLLYLVGDVGKIDPMLEALKSSLPLIPIIPVRIDVPLEAAKSRLETMRSEAYKGEAGYRQAVNQAFDIWERPQIGDLKAVFGLHTVLNLSPGEHAELGYDDGQVRPLTPKLLAELSDKFVWKAKKESHRTAKHILMRRTLDQQLGIPQDLIDVLETKLAPEAERRGIDICLKGGLAVAIYLGSSMQATSEKLSGKRVLAKETSPLERPKRQVSPDIDWTMVNEPEVLEAHQSMISEIMGADVTFEDAFHKAVFHSRKIAGETLSDAGQRVELDAIAVSRIQPGNEGFCFEFIHDGVMDFLKRELTLSNERRVSIVPPEMLIMEKLVAGRAIDTGKTDLSDAAGLMVTQPIDVTILRRIIENQTYDASLDQVPVNFEQNPAISDVAATIREAGIHDQRLVNIITERILLDHLPGDDEYGAAVSCRSTHILPFLWTADSVKKAAMVDKILSSLGKLEENLDQPVSIGEDAQTLSAVYGRDNLSKVIDALRTYLYYYCECQLGRNDVYTRRHGGIALEH